MAPLISSISCPVGLPCWKPSQGICSPGCNTSCAEAKLPASPSFEKIKLLFITLVKIHLCWSCPGKAAVQVQVLLCQSGLTWWTLLSWTSAQRSRIVMLESDSLEGHCAGAGWSQAGPKSTGQGTTLRNRKWALTKSYYLKLLNSARCYQMCSKFWPFSSFMLGTPFLPRGTPFFSRW